ncbi:Dopey, N-terminal-domain-containing protein [Xylogone sp. PMI_703]|nr:Dopey, N-terminal-domain-containing protein [Xylogone sp. PMI_703]
MALEPAGVGHQSASPTSSGRASPIPRKLRHHLDGDEYAGKDKAYRRYASGVEKSLSLFDTALQEWADYISFLGRLLKSLQAHPPNINIIPSKAIVARRLAQCLNPSLPSGVHQKSLEVYSYIFSMIGREALSRDLHLYLPGLSATLSFASLSVRTLFLELLEKYLLHLDSTSLRPALKALILALLPGLEEETSEDFESTVKLLNGFMKAVRPPNGQELGETHNSGDEYFWQCFFLATITSSGRRLGSLAYLVRYLPKLGHAYPNESAFNEENGTLDMERRQLAEMVTSPEPGLLLRCFAAGLADEQLLIQRGFLDLLVTHLPLHSSVLQGRVKREDLELLITAAIGVVTRRDMSLNRRLWAWLLGPEPVSTEPEERAESPTSTSAENPHILSRTHYFEQYGLRPLTQALLKMINSEYTSPVDRARPFRICLSLMDRWEIGGLVVPDIFLPVIMSVRKYKEKAAAKTDFTEVLRSASVFFDGVESGLIWGEVIELVTQAISKNNTSNLERIDKLLMVNFIISNFNVREEEMLLVHVPLTALTILTILDNTETQIKDKNMEINCSEEISRLALNIATDLLDLVPERAFIGRPSTSQSSVKSFRDDTVTLASSDILRNIQTFYSEEQGNLDAAHSPFSPREMSELLLREASKIASKSLSKPVSGDDAGIKSRLLVMMLAKLPKGGHIDIAMLLSAIHCKLDTSFDLPFMTFAAITSLSITLYSTSYITQSDIAALIDPLVRCTWLYLSSTYLKYHVEVVRYLWLLQSALTLANHEIEASICSLIVEHNSNSSQRAEAARRFTVLWTHTIQDSGTSDRRPSKASILETTRISRVSGAGNYEIMLSRPLFLMLDSLMDEHTQSFLIVRSWLQSLVGLNKMFYTFVTAFSDFQFLQTMQGSEIDTAQKLYTDEDDLDQCLYYLRILSSVLRWATDNTWVTLTETHLSTDKSNLSLYQITGRDGEVSLLEFFLSVCLRAISGRHNAEILHMDGRVSQFHRTALTIIHQIFLSPYALSLAELQLENFLLDRLMQSIDGTDPFTQVLLLDVVLAALRIRNAAIQEPPYSPSLEHKRPSTQEGLRSPRLSVANDSELASRIAPPPAALIKCLQAGFSAPSSRSVLDSWVSFLTECLPFYSDTIFQILMPLTETMCSKIGLSFSDLQTTFREPGSLADISTMQESTLISLLNGLEHVLAKGHDRLLQDEIRIPTVKSPDQPQGFFGNMVSGVFASETPQTRSVTANNRLTVLLSFQDAVRIGFTIWSWGGQGKDARIQDHESAASFTYTSLRMRNRARRLLEHLFAAEALECLETVVEVWQKSSKAGSATHSSIVFDLLHVLDGSRPKHTIPAIFNAIYSRTNPNALEPSRKSTLTTSLNDTDLVVFLVEYAKSLEDDAMDEIWTDCMTFLRDLLANPFPHRQTLPSLLEFAAILGEKVDNTNFGEQRRMRRELSDLFLRLLTAIFTTRPMGFADISTDKLTEKEERSSTSPHISGRSDDVVTILALITPNLPKILVDSDRVLSAATTISSSVVGPVFKSKSFPENISKSTLVLLYELSRLPNTQKLWRKDLADAFNDGRFFSNTISLVESDWLPLLKQWTLSDKERMPELLTRLAAPTTAGIVFGVGATSARLEADRKAQLNLRRIATLIIATMNDNFVTDLPVVQEKIVELLAATPTSSPSSSTRADIYILLRALVLKTSTIHLATLWPLINSELHSAISSVVAPDHSPVSETYNNNAILQACKLLDTLLCIAPEDFQLQEWLFITDTIDAVYRPATVQPVSLVDELAEELGSSVSAISTDPAVTHVLNSLSRRPLIGDGGIHDDINLERKDELVGKVLRPFFSQLSIFAFESTYSMAPPDWEACKLGLLKDLFDEKSIVRAP